MRRVAELTAEGDQSGVRERSVCIAGLPLAMQDASVRASIEALDGQDGDGQDSAGAGELPVAADLRVVLDVPEASEALGLAADDELEAARTAVRRLTERIAQIDRELGRYDQLTMLPRPPRSGTTEHGPPLASPTAARMSLLLFRDQRERGLRDERARVLKEQEDAARMARQLEDQHRWATAARQARAHELRKTIVVSLRGGSTARARLVIEYMVPGARWAPAYTVRLTPGQPASFAMRAVVAQRTGEDWRGVAMSLSTADAQGWTELPELSSIRIGRAQASTEKVGWRPSPIGASELYADYDRAFAELRSAVPVPADWDDETRRIPGRATDIQVVRRPELGELAGGGLLSDDFDDHDTGVREGAESLVDVESEERSWAPPPSLPPSAAYGAMPAAPMPAQSMSMPMAAPVARSKGGMLAGALAKKSRASAPPPAYFEIERTGVAGGGPPGFGGSAAAPPAPSITAADELLAYGNLRMPRPSSSARGKLTLAGRREIYLELLLAERGGLSFDALDVVVQANRDAAAVSRLSLPPRHKVARADRYDYAYSAENAVEVPSDGAFHSVPLIARSAEVAMRYVVVPRESTDVFRLAEVQNPLSAPILAGPVDVYLGKDFLLTGEVATTPPGGLLKLGLGVEQAVKVARNTAFHEETSGLMRGSLLLKHEIRIEIANNLPRAIDCEVRERIPAIRTDEEDIEIWVERMKPAASPYEPTDASSPEVDLGGGYVWRVRVDGGGKSSLALDYAVKIPSRYELIGGNRREA